MAIVPKKMLWLALLGAAVRGVNNPEEYANILIGTDSRSDFGYGSTLPLVGSPWGHTYWAPETENDDRDGWWFNPSSAFLVGLRCTHQPSPWISDWGYFKMHFGLDGWAGNDLNSLKDYWRLGWNVYNATTKPYHFGTDLLGIATEEDGWARVDMTANDQVAHIKGHWPKKETITGLNQKRGIWISREKQIHGIDQSGSDWDVSFTTRDSKLVTILKGFTTVRSDDLSIPDGIHYRQHFYMEFDAMYETSTWLPHHERPSQDDSFGLIFSDEVDNISVRVGVSLISQENAEKAIDLQLKTSFEDSLGANKLRWKQHLSVIDVIDTGIDDPIENERSLQTYYSNLWKASQFPRNIQEHDGNHWSPYDGKTHPGPFSTDSGFWDSYHTVYGLMSIIWPDQVSILMQGYMNAFQESGWIAQWSSPGFKTSMTGSMSDVVFADLMMKGFEFDYNIAMDSMLKNAFEEATEPGRGRRGVPYLDDLGYIPRDGVDALGEVHDVVGQTLLHSFCDFAILEAEKVVGTGKIDAEMRAKLEKRASMWRNLFHPEHHFHIAKYESGDWVLPFDEFKFGGDYTEGTAWQYRFFPPHASEELATLYGSRAELCAKVDEMNTAPTIFHRGSGNFYGWVTPSMIGVRLNVWGHYAHNNQPSHHLNYVPISVARNIPELKGPCVSRAHYWIKKTMTELYTPLYYSGDEDNGEMSAWLILSSLGFYPMTPATQDYMVGVPLFKHVRVNVHGKMMTVRANKNCRKCSVVNSVSWNGKLIDDWRFSWDQLLEGGELRFYMEDEQYAAPEVNDPADRSRLRK